MPVFGQIGLCTFLPSNRLAKSSREEIQSVTTFALSSQVKIMRDKVVAIHLPLWVPLLSLCRRCSLLLSRWQCPAKPQPLPGQRRALVPLPWSPLKQNVSQVTGMLIICSFGSNFVTKFFLFELFNACIWDTKFGVFSHFTQVPEELSLFVFLFIS